MNEAPTNRQRFIVSKLVIDMCRTIYPQPDGRFGSNADVILVTCAIAVGTFSGQPMGATKISHYIGMPRASVVIRLPT